MLSAIARFLLKIGGWTPIGATPDVPKAVLIAAPHTSNWDAYWGLVYKVAIGIDAKFFAKESLFWFPLGNLLRALGGIPLDRTHAGSSVQQAIDAFAANDSFYFGLAPEGTRSKRPGWKSGFYRIAVGAGVPVALGYFDYGRKRIGIGALIDLTGDEDADLDRIRAYYDEHAEGRWPEKASPIEFHQKRK